MTDPAHSQGIKFLLGATLSFSAASSIQMLDRKGRLPGDMEYSTSYPLAYTGVAGAVHAYDSQGQELYETLGEYPGFLAGAMAGTYLAEKTFENLSGSGLEESYKENDLGDIWDEVKKDMEDTG